MADREETLQAAIDSLRNVVSETLQAAIDSLRNVVSIRDFLIAVQVGAETAIGMLDKIENKLIEAMEAINEDFGR